LPLSHKEIAEILKIIDASNCEELVVEMDDVRLVVRRGGAGGGVEASYSDGQKRVSGAAEAFESGMVQPARAEPGEAGTGGDAADAARPDGMILIHAPTMGTFYRGASPQDPPFVEVGDRVAPGDPLCLIEVMKLYTTIEAEQAGRIVEIGAENEAAVEHGQLLFVIDPA
jgi:acetyl-CoA carboxylase biotin carboxyl carrier protein